MIRMADMCRRGVFEAVLLYSRLVDDGYWKYAAKVFEFQRLMKGRDKKWYLCVFPLTYIQILIEKKGFNDLN